MTIVAQSGSPTETVRIRVRRQDAPGKPSYWEEFELPKRPNANVISLLMEIQKNPVNVRGEKVTPVVWESNCLEEVCGACTMVINGKVRQACSAVVEHLPQPISIEPMKTMPVVRDLMVDRSRMFQALKRVRAWVDIDGTHDLGPGPKLSPEDQEWQYELSKCMVCGCCLDVCPNYGPQSEFVGAFALSAGARFNDHPTGAMHSAGRLDNLMGPGGLTECGNAQNCVKACPKGIPLTEAIAQLNKQATVYSIKRFFRGR